VRFTGLTVSGRSGFNGFYLDSNCAIPVNMRNIEPSLRFNGNLAADRPLYINVSSDRAPLNRIINFDGARVVTDEV
jgi:hypothetical protein